jgi:RNA polymerase sigma-70 factor (ECF subfamily)
VYFVVNQALLTTKYTEGNPEIKKSQKLCKDSAARSTNECRQLISQTQETDMTQITPEIFEAEAMQHIDDLYRTATRLTMNQTDADDLVQETFMQAWKSFDHYELGTNCRAWLYKILFNKFDHYRRKKYTQAKYFQEADELVLANSVQKASVPENLTDREVIDALDKLPDHYRSVVLLADLHEFDYKEVAQILDIPIGTVMSRLNRARTQLKKSLATVAADYGIKTAHAQLAA